MGLKEILHVQMLKQSDISKDVSKTKKYINKNYYAFDFKSYEIIEIDASYEVLPNYYLVDLIDSKNKIIINVDERINKYNKDALKEDGYHVIDLFGRKIKKKQIKDELTLFLDVHTKASDNLVGGLRQRANIPNENVLTIIEQERLSNVDNHSIDVTELIGRSPNWILKSGIGIVGITLLLLLSIAYLVKFPDKITTSGYITTTSPPLSIKAKSTGIIHSISAENETHVKKGAELFYIKNTANRSDIATFLDFINDYKDSDKFYFVLGKNIPEDLQLGEMQSQYAQFKLNYQEYQQILKSSNITEQLSTIDNEINKTNHLIQIQETEKGLFQQELALSIKDQERNKILNDEGIISDINYEKVLITETQKRRQLASMSNGVVQNQIKIDQLKLQVKQLSEDRNNTINKYRFLLEEDITNILESHMTWSDKYIISAEEEGTFHYSRLLKPGISILPDNEIAYITHNEEKQKVFTSSVHASGIGKLSEGSKAIITIDAYPSKEYGSVLSKIHSISRLPIYTTDDKDYYEISVLLNEQITTDYGEEIVFTPKMKASVAYITEEKSVLSRIFEQILDLINQ